MNKFDWVEACSNCTASKVFKQLSADAQEDLNRHKSLNPSLAQHQQYDAEREDMFSVKRSGDHCVVFQIKNEKIHIDRWDRMGNHTHLMELDVQLDKKGNCVLIDKQKKMFKPWQVRRKALEKTLFG